MTTIRQDLLNWPYLPLGNLFQLMVVIQKFAYPMLEIERTLLHLGMHLSVDKNTGIEVLLRVVTQPLVFGQDSLEHLIDFSEIIVAGILMSVNLVFHRAVKRRCWHTSHYIEEMRS